jgi:hypothetical protein
VEGAWKESKLCGKGNADISAAVLLQRRLGIALPYHLQRILSTRTKCGTFKSHGLSKTLFRKLAEIQKQDWKALTIDEKKAGKSTLLSRLASHTSAV